MGVSIALVIAIVATLASAASIHPATDKRGHNCDSVKCQKGPNSLLPTSKFAFNLLPRRMANLVVATSSKAEVTTSLGGDLEHELEKSGWVIPKR
jgi:hypothetical protein